MSENKKADPFYSAKDKLRDALKGGIDAPKFEREEIEALILSRPTCEPPRNVSAGFCPEYLRFLQPAIKEQMALSRVDFAGVNVERHPRGGVVLMATTGRIMLLAYDTTGECSEGGMRFSVPSGAFEACKTPKPFSLEWNGVDCEIEDEPPGYAIPRSVFAYGLGLIVMPKEQPEGTNPEDGGALFSVRADRSGDWCDDRYCIGDAANWRPMIAGFIGDAPNLPISVHAEIMPAVADAMKEFPETVWSMRRSANNTIMIVPQNRNDLCIIVASAKYVGDDKGTPDWLREITP